MWPFSSKKQPTTVVAQRPQPAPAAVIEPTKPKTPPAPTVPPKPKKVIREQHVSDLADIADFRHAIIETTKLRYSRSEESARSWIRRLSDARLLKSHKFVLNEKYWTLTRKAVVLLRQEHGVHVSHDSTYLSPGRMLEYHAFLRFCSQPDLILRRCRPCLMPQFDDVRKKFLDDEHKHDPIRHLLFYVDEPRGVVGHFTWDKGTDDCVTKLVKRRIRNLMASYPSFLVQAKRDAFVLSVATSTEFRRDQLEAQFKKEEPPFPYQIIVIPELEAVQVFANAKKRQQQNRKKKK